MDGKQHMIERMMEQAALPTCPLLPERRCAKENCGWWTGTGCAVVEIAEALTILAEQSIPGVCGGYTRARE